jgi:hypothetical protein
LFFFPTFHNYLKFFYHRVWHLMLFFSPFITTVYNFLKKLRWFDVLLLFLAIDNCWLAFFFLFVFLENARWFRNKIGVEKTGMRVNYITELPPYPAFHSRFEPPAIRAGL